MDDTPMNLVALAVEIMITLLVISFIGFALYLGNQMQRSYQREIDVANRMNDFAMFSKYDAVLVSGSDVLEAIFRYADDGFVVQISGTPINIAPPNPPFPPPPAPADVAFHGGPHIAVGGLWLDYTALPAGAPNLNRPPLGPIPPGVDGINALNVTLAFLTAPPVGGGLPIVVTDRDYRADLVIGGNGDIIGVRFIRLDP